MKIALAQLNYLIGDFAGNTRRIIRAIEQSKSGGAELVIFAELSVCGYPPRDFLEFKDFNRKSRDSVEQIAARCQGIAAIVGAPSENQSPKGKPLFNSAWFLADGKIREVIHKTLLPNYDVFDEYRYFEPNRDPYRIIEFKGRRLAVTICEDLWNISDDPLYIRNPMDELIRQSPEVIINIAASPFHYHQPERRNEIFTRNVQTYGIPLVYVNQTGGHTELIFDGDSMVMNARGEVKVKLKSFSEDIVIHDLTSEISAVGGEKVAAVNSGTGSADPYEKAAISGFALEKELHVESLLSDPALIGRIHDALTLGIRDYFAKMGFRKAILGLSGGIDSAVVLALAAGALGPENVLAVLLPSGFSSEHSITDALALTTNLGVAHQIIPIEPTYLSVNETLKPIFGNLPFNLTEENIQARLRGVILMALSNKFGYILLNTSNKSEAAVGYGTLYGDMCGGLSVLGDVYKTQVYGLARFINRDKEIIPMNSILKPPSAELRPGQKDSDSLPEYRLLDQLLYLYIEQRYGPSDLTGCGFGRELVERVLKLVNTSEYKRHQTPPILRISPKAFGQGRRMPIVGKYLS